MTTARLQNIATYVAIGVGILLIQALGRAIGNGAVAGFMDGQTFESVRSEIGGLLTLLGTAGGLWMAANRPRQGSERLSAQVEALRADDVDRADMTVIKTEDLDLLKQEAERLRRVKPLRDLAAADETLERQARG